MIDENEASEDLSLRAVLPRSTGLSLAVNAVSDAYLLIDAPHCAYRRLAYVQGNHDLESDLALFPGMPRVSNTELSPLKVIKNRDLELEEHLTALASCSDAGVVLVDAVAMAMITAADYGRICTNISEKTGKLVFPVPHRSLTSDYLTAYAEVMETLATGLPLHLNRNGNGRSVAIVGYFWDRGEGDHRANLAEIQRIFRALDLDLVSLWFSGQPTGELQKIEQADYVVSLPYGRRAARILSDRLGAELIPGEIPFGIAATIRFVLTLAAATNRLDRAIAFLESDLGDQLPRLKWIAPFALTHRRWGYVGDPHLFPGLNELAYLVGAKLPFAAYTNLPQHCRALRKDRDPLLSLQIPEDIRELAGIGSSLPDLVMTYPHAKELADKLAFYGTTCGLDLLVTNSFGFLTEGMGIVEFGFPSYHTHFLSDNPFLGIRGALAFLERIINASRDYEVRAIHRQKQVRHE